MVAEETHDYALRYQLSPQALRQLTWKKHDFGTEIVGPGLTVFIAQQEPSVKEETAFVSENYGSKQFAPRLCAQAAATDYSFLSILFPTRHSRPRIEARGNDAGHTVSVGCGDSLDSWQWCPDSRRMSRHSSDGIQQWRMPKGDHHG